MTAASEERAIDAIEIEVFNNRILAIIEEMGAKLVRSSFSPNIKERRDCSVALFDVKGRTVAQAAHIPMHLGSLTGAIDAVLRDFPMEEMLPGDAYICHDAYLAGGTHLPDISIVTPIFCDGAVRFFTACLGHHSDVGGAVPGSISPDAATIFEEGIRIPPIKFVSAGVLEEGVMQIIAQNTREPEERILDLKVQIATNELGVARIGALVERMGVDAVEAAIEDLLLYTERRLKTRVAALRDGSYSFTTWMDDDGIDGEKVPLKATIVVKGDHLLIDFTGTGPQSRGGYNLMETGVLATVSYTMKALLDPGLPPNSGLFGAIDFLAPEGSIINPNYPAAVGARTTTCQKLAGAIFGAMAEVLPEEKIMASSHNVLGAFVVSGQSKRRDGAYVYIETMGGGNGARFDKDGMDGAHCHITNSLNMPAESVEHEFPLMIHEYALVADSGGAGRHRGGMGIARDIRVLHDGTTFTGRADSYLTTAEGYDGGLNGGNCRVVRNHGTAREEAMSPKQRLMVLKEGETVRMETPGAGGLGRPADRDPAALASDLADGKVSREAALRDYGPTLVEKALALL